MICRKVIVGKGSAHPLNGLLTLPEGVSGRVPAVVMVHGSGPSNMDEKVGKLTPFKDLAEGLAARGIASLRYDKRTFVYAKEMRKTVPSVNEETIDDAVLAVKLLKRVRVVDPGRIFLLGHSMGAMLAPRIDAEGADVCGLILMAGTPYRLEDIVLRQLKQAGGGPVLGTILKHQYKKYSRLFSGLYQLSEEEARQKKFGGKLPLTYFQDMGRRTAADYLLESEKPVLILQGGKDFQVLPEEDFRRFRELLAGRSGTEFKLYPGLNHLFVEGIYSDILKASKEYGVERHIGDEVTGDIAAFIRKAGQPHAEEDT